MAQLDPKDPQFGIPIAARIKKELAFQLQADADKNNLSFSKYLGVYLNEASRNVAKLLRLETQLIAEREIFRKAIGRFILSITQGDKKETTQLIESYNSILQEETNQTQSKNKTI